MSADTETPRRMVEVEWLDSVTIGDGWITRDDLQRLARDPAAMRHRTVGYLIDEGDEYLLLVGSAADDGGTVSGTMQIPRVAILGGPYELRR